MKYIDNNSDFTKLREKAGLSVQEVADRLGYTLRTVYRWEKGEIKPRKPVTDLLGELASKGNNLNVTYPSLFTFVDLFAGIGGTRKGFEAIGGRCIFTSEWDMDCRKTYQANFLCDHPVEGDITKIEASDIPHHDVLLAGFPCQPFSIAGISKRRSLGRKYGFECEEQGSLFFEAARVIDYHKPIAFFLENVKNLASHDSSKSLEIIIQTLTEIGYHVQWKIIDAKGFVPQHRERLYIVGFLKETGFTFNDLILPDPQSVRLQVILHPEDGSEPEEPPYTIGVKGCVSERYYLSPRLWEYLQHYAEKHRAKGNGFGYGLCGPDDISRTLSARYYKDGSEILINRNGYVRPRRLTPRECARLMGFDTSGKSPFQIPVSDTQAYKQFGNAVAVPVVQFIAREMLPHIVGQKRNSSGLQLEFTIPQLTR